MAQEVTIGSRRYWIVSEPAPGGWRAQVLEVLDVDGRSTQEVGIHATADTRAAADEKALGRLQRLLRAKV